jgi:hypothetical protein
MVVNRKRYPRYYIYHLRVLDLQQLLHGEYDENEVRKDFTPTEKVAIGQAIEAEIAAENAARQQEGRKKGGETGGRGRPKAESNGDSLKANSLQAKTAKQPQTRTVAAKKAGMSDHTYTKAKAVVAAAQAEPERFGDLPAKMDAEDNVEAAYKAMQHRRHAEAKADDPREQVSVRGHSRATSTMYPSRQSVPSP